MSIKVAINGFGRIGRPSFKIAMDMEGIEIVAINDLTDNNTLAHLLKYDSNYGVYEKSVESSENALIIDGKEIPAFSEPDPTKLPWGDLGVDVVLECTGVFRTHEKASLHVEAGAKMVIISAPGKDGPISTFVRAVNDSSFDPEKNTIIDNASCTTNSVAPPMEVLQRRFGVEKAFLSTIHSYTSDQNLIDGPHKDMRRARSAALNIIPTSTGAAQATCKVVEGIDASTFDGLSFRVPTPVVSVSDITALLSREVTAEEVNTALKEESETERYKGIIGYTEDEIVSMDIKKSSFSGVIDSRLTRVVGGDLLKLVVWYDNEWAYSTRLVEQALDCGKRFS